MPLYDQLIAKLLISIVRNHPIQQLKEHLLIIADYLHAQDHPASKWLTLALSSIDDDEKITVGLENGTCELAIRGTLTTDSLKDITNALGDEWAGFGTYSVDGVEIRLRSHRGLLFTAYFQLADYS